MPGRRLSIHLVLCLSLLAAALPQSMGQVSTGDVVGRVIDASGAVLPNAKVTIKNSGTAASRTVQTGHTGDYNFSLLQAGTYEVTIEATGFRTFVMKDLSLLAGDRVRVDGKLEVGMTSESISVKAAPDLQADSSTIGTSITTEPVADLPLNGRNLTNLVQLSPGVTEGAFNAAAPPSTTPKSCWVQNPRRNLSSCQPRMRASSSRRWPRRPRSSRSLPRP